VDEEEIGPRRIEALDDPGRAPVAAAGGEHDLPATVAEEARRLHLHARGPPIEVGDEVAVGAMAERNEHASAGSHQPSEGR
jgi:hypothetical protein